MTSHAYTEIKLAVAEITRDVHSIIHLKELKWQMEQGT